MTLKLPKQKESPIHKYRRIANTIRGNGKTPLIRVAAVCGYSPIYFKYNILPCLLEFFEDIRTDGNDVWCEKSAEASA